MNILSAIFEMRKLKNIFYYFLLVLVLLAVGSLAIVWLTAKTHTAFINGKTGSWLLFAILFIISYSMGTVNKKELANLRKADNNDDLFDKYIQYYKKRLLLNCVAVAITAILFVLTYKSIYFYLLLTQILLSPVFYPRQSQIQKELPDYDISFAQ